MKAKLFVIIFAAFALLAASALGQTLAQPPSPVGSGLPTLPTSPNGVTQTITSTPSGGVGGAATWSFFGVVPNTHICPSNVDTISATDATSLVIWTDASACASSLPQAGVASGFTSNIVIAACNGGAGTVTLTPIVSTLTIYSGGAPSTGQTSATFTQGQCATIYSNNTNYILVYKGGTSYPDIIDNAGVSVTFGAPLLAPSSGSCAAPAYGITSKADTGWYWATTNTVAFCGGGASPWYWMPGGSLVLTATGWMGFSNNGADASTTKQVGFSDEVAGSYEVMALGTAQGDETGTLRTGNIQRITGSNYTNATTTPSALFSWTANQTWINKTWNYSCTIIYQSSVTTDSLALSINASQTPVNEAATATIYTTLTGTETDATVTSTSSGTVAVLTGAAPNAATTNYKATLTGGVELNASASGTFSIQAASSAAGTITILRDASFCTLQ